MKVISTRLARAQASLDRTVRGTRAERDETARAIFADWLPLRRRASRL